MKSASVAASMVGMLGVALLAQPALPTREEVLAAVYPGAEIEAERLFLTDDHVRRIEASAGAALPSPLVARYTARRGGRVVGRAYVDTHVVRTKQESLLIALGPDGRVRRVEVTAFFEPREYLAPERWMEQFDQKALTDDLAVQRAIRPIAGATLTARATTAAVRRALAIDRVMADAASLE